MHQYLRFRRFMWMRPGLAWKAFLCLLLWCTSPALIAAVNADAARIRYGEYLFTAAGCVGCHTQDTRGAAPLAGGRRFETAFGAFYSPNITPDPTYGIGGWSDADFIRALREGVGPDGRHYYPAFPYTSYTRLTDDDMRAIKSYLFTAITPVAQPNRSHQLVWYARFRPLMTLWKLRYFSPGAYSARPDRSARWNRGAYLATAVAHCGECHTARDRFGGFRADLYFAGNREGPEGSAVPNITPDEKTGIGRWRESELIDYLETGMDPNGDFAGDLMTEVIDNGLAYLTRTDRAAIAHYVLSLPAIEHDLGDTRNKGEHNETEEFQY